MKASIRTLLISLVVVILTHIGFNPIVGEQIADFVIPKASAEVILRTGNLDVSPSVSVSPEDVSPIKEVDTGSSGVTKLGLGFDRPIPSFFKDGRQRCFYICTSVSHDQKQFALLGSDSFPSFLSRCASLRS